MTLTPEAHYQRADALLAELELCDPQVAPRLPGVQFKLRLAELHAQLAVSPWWPGVAEHPDPWPDDDLDELRARINGGIETRIPNGDML